MNVDTDCQYAFSRPIVEHMFKNYDGVLKIEGEVGNKKVYIEREAIDGAFEPRHRGHQRSAAQAPACWHSAFGSIVCQHLRLSAMRI